MFFFLLFAYIFTKFQAQWPKILYTKHTHTVNLFRELNFELKLTKNLTSFKSPTNKLNQLKKIPTRRS